MSIAYMQSREGLLHIPACTEKEGIYTVSLPACDRAPGSHYLHKGTLSAVLIHKMRR